MNRAPLLFFFFINIILSSCHKSGENIDVSSQWFVDYNGNLISGPSDGQWQFQIFTSQELNLFNSLDTANLSGTIMPDSVLTTTSCYNCIFPNPFESSTSFLFHFSNGYNGQMVFKSVVVDSHMNIVDKSSQRIQGKSDSNIVLNPSISNIISLSPHIPIGKFRIYFTLSTAANQHFYQSWGNIEKIQ
jgi:hypothetical protein